MKLIQFLMGYSKYKKLKHSVYEVK